MFFDFVVKASQSDSDKKGGLLVNNSLEYPRHAGDVQRFASDAFRQMTAYFEKSFRRGQGRGEIPATVQTSQTAKAFVTSVVGLCVLGRGTFGTTALLQIVEQARRLIS